MNYKSTIKLIAATAIAGTGLYVFLRGTDTHKLVAEFRHINPFTLGCACALAIMAIKLRAIRWSIILPDTSPAHKKNLFSHTIIGFMINNIIPARAGEAARALLLWKKNGYSPTVSLGSLFLERLVDIIFFLPCFFIPVFILNRLKNMMPIALAVSSLFFASILTFVIFAVFPVWLKKIGCILFVLTPRKFHEKIRMIGKELATVGGWIYSPWRVAAFLALSISIPSMYAVIMVLLFADPRMFGIVHGFFAIAFSVVGAAIPLAPGYIGTLHATLLQGLRFLGINEEAGRAMAVMYHGVGYIPIIIVGFIYFLKVDMSFSEMSHAKEVMKE